MSLSQCSRNLAMLATSLACVVGAVIADTSPTISGAPSDREHGTGSVTLLPPGLDDTLRPLVESTGLPAPALDAGDLSDRGEAEPVVILLWERLAAIPSEACGEAVIELEFGRDAEPSDLITARAIVALWSGGRHAQAIEMLRGFEEAGARMGLGIAWTSGCAPAGLREDADVRIGGERTDASTGSLDFDEQSGNLFSVIGWGAATGTAYWTANVSTDHGATWAETYEWYSAVGIIDADAAVVGDYLYVGYVVGGTAGEVRVRRCMVDDGAVDGTYGFHVALDAGTDTFSDIAMVANADDYDNRIYCLAIQSNHTLRFAWGLATDGTTFTDVAPPGVANASYGLAATYDNNLECDPFLFVSYAGTDQGIHVQKRTDSAWTDVIVASGVGALERTSISAYGENVICAYEMPMSGGDGILYRMSYTCGDTWSVGTLAEPDVGSCRQPAVDARNGLGTAVVYQKEIGEPDEAYYRFRMGFAPGAWEAPSVFTDHDVLTGSDMTLSPLSHGASSMDHGAIYISGGLRIPYFDQPNPAASEVPVVSASAATLQLLPAVPNPASGSTTIRFLLPTAGHVRLEVLDVLGRHVATLLDGPLDAGMHAIPFDARHLGSRVCFYRLISGSQERENRITVIR